MASARTCPFCNLEYDPADAPAACGHCALAGSCHMVRCPRCGYEMPAESRLSKWLRSFTERRKEIHTPNPKRPERVVDQPARIVDKKDDNNDGTI